MGKVLEIGFASAKGDRIQNISSVEALKGKGLLMTENLEKIIKKNAKSLL